MSTVAKRTVGSLVVKATRDVFSYRGSQGLGDFPWLVHFVSAPTFAVTPVSKAWMDTHGIIKELESGVWA